MTTVNDEIIPWFDSLREDTVVLTPNRRLGRFVQQQYGCYQQLQGRQAWPTLPCFSINGWLQSLWEKLQQCYFSGSDRILLNSVQETLIWERIIQEHSRGHELLNPRHTAAIAIDAWHKLQQWQLGTESLDSRQVEMALFKHWTDHYFKLCRDGKYTDGSQVITTLKQAVDDSILALPKAIALYGFDVITPLTRSLLDRFAERGVDVYPVNISKNAEIRRIQLDDEESEIVTAARWAAALLARHDGNRPIQIGIVVPQLATIYAKVERLFNNVFEPQHLLTSNARHVPLFNLSAAQPLGEIPMVQAALNALQLNRPQLDIELISHILRSPFIGITDELSTRAVLDVELRAASQMVSTPALRAAAGKSGCPDLFRRLQQFHQIQGPGYGNKRMPSEWALIFAGQLQVLGWPGVRPLDSLEFQQVQHWHQVMQQLAGLDAVFGAGDIHTVLAQLRHLALQHPFHARTATSPVQILGMLEAAGMLFDYVWVMHMDDRNWPMAPQPNPLIPIRQQMELHMPRVSVDAELQFARVMTKRLAGSAQRVIFSYGRFHGDQELRPSPLLEEYAVTTTEQLDLVAAVDYERDLYGSAVLVSCTDDLAPHISDPAVIRGGTQILKDQAACPFRAYARHRLHAREIEQVVPGISPIEHGLLMHRALEMIWQKLGSHTELLRLRASELQSIIEQAISESFLILPRHVRPGKRLQDMESQRMRGLIGAWLELEKQRQPFSVVFSERERELNLAGLPLRVRYDRVDKLADGRWFVIDYKTGVADIGAWSGNRPDEPQVPVYCITNPENISGAAFGILKVGETGFRGIAEDEAIAPGIKQPAAVGNKELPDDWHGIMQQWREVLESLATEFLNGSAAVDPKSKASSCRFCALPGLCRIGECSAQEEAEPGRENEDAG